MELLDYREIHGPANEYAWTIIFQYRTTDCITDQKEILKKLINSEYLNKQFFKNSTNNNSFIHNIWRPLPLYKITIDNFEFITTTDRLREVFDLNTFIFDSSDQQDDKYNSEILHFLLAKLHDSNGIWYISSKYFEDDFKNDFVQGGINTELFVSIDTNNQTVTTVDYGSD